MAAVTLPPPTVPPAGGPPVATPVGVPSPPSTAPGWYDDPWDARGLRWWDGGAWTGYTDALYAGGRGSSHGADADAVEAVRRTLGAGRLLAALLPLVPVAQMASLATSSSDMRDLFRELREGAPITRAATQDLTAWMAVGQVLSLLTVVALVLRMIWLARATRAAGAVGFPVRRSPGWAGAGWIIPILNFWWPFQGVRAVVADREAHGRALVWWWLSYLVGTIGGAVALMATWSLAVPGAVAVMAVPAASLLVSALLERRLVLAVQADLRARVGLNPG